MQDFSFQDNDTNAANRKQDHIELAFQSQVTKENLDKRFYYEPLLGKHPTPEDHYPFEWHEHKLSVPIWVSSMTGGTEWAEKINKNLARVCKDFGMGMGLGSCRAILTSNERLADFNVRKYMGDDSLLFANLGIAQVEQLAASNKWHLIKNLIDKLSANGLILHVNPIQEWLQPEGDRFGTPSLEIIERTLDNLDFPIIVKEVGQGMGLESLKKLFQLPLYAIDFAAHGGTNFAKIELFRGSELQKEIYEQLALVGHNALEMVLWSNEIAGALKDRIQCKHIIISGGIKSFLDGYYLMEKSSLPAIYGQASAFLKHAMGDYEALYEYTKTQIEGLKFAKAFLKVRP